MNEKEFGYGPFFKKLCKTFQFGLHKWRGTLSERMNLGQGLWLSWQNGRFWYQRSTVQIQILVNFNKKHLFTFQLYYIEKTNIKKEKEAGNGHFIKKNESVRVSTNSLCKEQSCWTTNGLKIVPQNYSPHLCWSSSVYFNKLSDWLIACHVIRFGQSECPDAWAARTEAVNFNFNRWTVFWDTFRIKFWQVLACMYVVCVFVMTSSNFRSWLLPNSYLVDQKSWQKMIA